MRNSLVVRALSAVLALGLSVGVPIVARAESLTAEGDAAQDAVLSEMAEPTVLSVELDAGPDVPTQLMQGVDSFIDTTDVYDDDGEILIDTVEYERYSIPDDQLFGCVCTVTFTDGNTQKFTFKGILEMGVDDDFSVAVDWYDENDEHADCIGWADEQGPDNVWQVGEQRGICAVYRGFNGETGAYTENRSNYLLFDIVANPIESIEFVPSKTVLYQGQDSGSTMEYGEDGEPTGNFFDYYYYAYEEGARLTINYTEAAGGPKTYVAIMVEGVEEFPILRFVNENDPSDWIDESDVAISDDQYENHWGSGVHTFTVEYNDFTCEGTVEVRENWVSSFAFNPVEPFVFVRGVDSQYGPYPFYTETGPVTKMGDIYPSPSFRQGDQLVVQTTADSEVIFTFNAQTGCFEPADAAYESIPKSEIAIVGDGYVDPDGQGIPHFHWEVGTQPMELYYMASRAPFTVTVEKGAPRKANTIKATATTKQILTKNAKAAAQTLSLITVKSAQGEVSYHKISGSDKLTIDEKTGKVTLAKGTGAGTYTMVVHAFAEGNEAYESGPSQVTVTVKVVDKFANTMVVKAVTKKAKLSKVSKKAVTVARPLSITKAQGTLSFKKSGGSKNFTVNAKTGKVTVKKGTKKGTYTIKIKVTAKGNSSYKSASKTVKTKIVVK